MKDDIIQFQQQRIEALEKELQAAKEKLFKKYDSKKINQRIFDPVFEMPINKVIRVYNN